MQKETDKIVTNIAEKYNVPKEVVKAIFESQFYCAKESIKKSNQDDPDSFPTIRFKNLGTLNPRKQQIIKINENRKSSES